MSVILEKQRRIWADESDARPALDRIADLIEERADLWCRWEFHRRYGAGVSRLTDAEELDLVDRLNALNEALSAEVVAIYRAIRDAKIVPA